MWRYKAYISNKPNILPDFPNKFQNKPYNTNPTAPVMLHPFPTISKQKQPQAWAITPNGQALTELAKGIWDCAKQTHKRPLVVLSTAGPLIGVRAALEQNRPKDLPSNIAFLPKVISFADWLEAAPGAW